jgi:hypothetical protein
MTAITVLVCVTGFILVVASQLVLAFRRKAEEHADELYRFKQEAERTIRILIDAEAERAARAKARIEALKALPRKCANCKHFDLEEGQAALSQGVFRELMRHVPPAQMANRTLYDTDGKALPDDQQPKETLPQKARWRHFGACLLHHEVRYQEDVCDQFEVAESRVVALHAQETAA